MRQHTIAVLQALFVVFLWATSWVFIKIGLKDIPPVTFAGLRYFLASVCLLVAVLFSGAKNQIRQIPKAGWRQLFSLGILLYAGTQGAVFVALAYLPAVTVNLLWSFSSVVIALLGIIWLSERPTTVQWIGIFMASAGALVYFYPANIATERVIGIIVALLGVLANAAAAILGRDLNRAGKYAPLVITIISMGVGSITLLIAGLFTESVSGISLQNWGIILWLALVNTAFAFTLWNHTMRTLTAMESSIINGTMLIWIPILAVIFLGESLTAKEIVGLSITGVGTLVVQLRKRVVPVTQVGDR